MALTPLRPIARGRALLRYRLLGLHQVVHRVAEAVADSLRYAAYLRQFVLVFEDRYPYAAAIRVKYGVLPERVAGLDNASVNREAVIAGGRV